MHVLLKIIQIQGVLYQWFSSALKPFMRWILLNGKRGVVHWSLHVASPSQKFHKYIRTQGTFKQYAPEIEKPVLYV